jgi:hypothetical protein
MSKHKILISPNKILHHILQIVDEAGCSPTQPGKLQAPTWLVVLVGSAIPL